MATRDVGIENRVREERLRRGWSQEELARRSSLSRTGIGAIESGRLVPSAAAALALAATFSCRVEDLFSLRCPPPKDASWAWPPARTPARYWQSEVGGQTRLYPVESTPLGLLPHDGILDQAGAASREASGFDPRRTLVMASCDPAVGLLAAELLRTAEVRLVAIPRPSRAALGLLAQGLVHVAGVHLTCAERSEGNASVVRTELGGGYTLIRVARWEEGIAMAPGLRLATVREAVRANLRWVGRQAGSGARQCLDDLLGPRRVPRRLATDHHGVTEAVRGGWADAGVCLRLTSEDAGLDFLGVREESYDLCFPSRWKSDPRIQALLNVLRSPSYHRALGELPGYHSEETGGLLHVN